MAFLGKKFHGNKIPWNGFPCKNFPWKKISLLCRITFLKTSFLRNHKNYRSTSIMNQLPTSFGLCEI